MILVALDHIPQSDVKMSGGNRRMPLTPDPPASQQVPVCQGYLAASEVISTCMGFLRENTNMHACSILVL